jgi:hypothetical protein
VKDLREIRRLYSIYDVLGLSSRKNKIVCPLPMHVHSSNTASFHIFSGSHGEELFECFGTCGKHGDVIDLVGYLHIPGYDDHNHEDISRAIELLGQRFTWHEPGPIERPVVLLPDAWREYTPPGESVVAYARRRGLDAESIRRFKLGQFEHWMSIPYFEEGLLRGIKFRNIEPGLRFMMAKGSKSGLFNYDEVAYTEAPLLFLKGEIPTMLLAQYGVLACGLTSGESTRIEKWVPVLSFSKRIVVVGDNDLSLDTDLKMSDKAREHAEQLHAVLKFPPVQYKDIDDWVLAEPEVALPIIKSWLED